MTAGKIIFLLYWSWILAKSACSQTLSDINCVLQRNPGTDPNKQVIRHERWSASSTEEATIQMQFLEKDSENIHQLCVDF